MLIIPPSRVYHVEFKSKSITETLKLGEIFPKYSSSLGELIAIVGGVFIVKYFTSDSYLASRESFPNS